MKHILLDAEIFVDLCVDRAGTRGSELAVACARSRNVALWLYAGSAQLLEYLVAMAILDAATMQNRPCERGDALARARTLIAGQTRDFRWLAALSGEAASFDTEDPEAERMLRALERFAPGAAVIVTRDDALIRHAGDQALMPEALIDRLGGEPGEKAVDFADLASQQDAIRPSLEKNIHRVLHHGQYVMGPEVRQLEERLAAYVGVRHCIAASSGTDTLLIALMALGLEAGDEVITTPFTFVATGEMIALLGAKPVFVDIDPRTYNIDPTKIGAAITPRTKAIIPVSLYGQCADMDAINGVAARYGLPVIEDAAQSFGATYKGRKSCALSTIGSTSFFPSKPLGGYGDGGALFTDDDSLAKAMREIRAHGQDRRYHHPRVGLNGRLDTLQAAVVLAKMDRFDWEVARRKELGAAYSALFAARCPEVVVPYVEPHNTSVYAQYSILVDNRETLASGLLSQGIPTAVHYPVPLHRQPAYRAFCRDLAAPVAERVAARVLSLPMSADLAPALQERVVDAVAKLTSSHQ